MAYPGPPVDPNPYPPPGPSLDQNPYPPSAVGDSQTYSSESRGHEEVPGNGQASMHMGSDLYPPIGTTEKSPDTAGPSSAEKITDLKSEEKKLKAKMKRLKEEKKEAKKKMKKVKKEKKKEKKRTKHSSSSSSSSSSSNRSSDDEMEA